MPDTGLDSRNIRQGTAARFVNWVIRFMGYIALGCIVMFIIYIMVIRPWHLRWGAADADVLAHLPGDELVKRPKTQYTRAITINASVDKVWPWLVQMGYKKAGFYTYDFINDFLGAADYIDGDRSSYRIIPELQNLKTGDRLVPFSGAGYRLIAMETERVLVYFNKLNTKNGRELGVNEKLSEEYVTDSWVFYLYKINENETRLIVRRRCDYTLSFMNFIFSGPVFEPLNFIMEQEMMKGIKKRAETAER